MKVPAIGRLVDLRGIDLRVYDTWTPADEKGGGHYSISNVDWVLGHAENQAPFRLFSSHHEADEDCALSKELRLLKALGYVFSQGRNCRPGTGWMVKKDKATW